MGCSDTRGRCAAGAYLVMTVVVGVLSQAGSINGELAAFTVRSICSAVASKRREQDTIRQMPV